MNQSEIISIILICAVPKHLRLSVYKVAIEGETAYNAAKETLGDVNAQVQIRRYVTKVNKLLIEIEQLNKS
ncbi:MAG: hypothetical protein COA84_14130 [Robiginitomaculum sp.]|nr:MAG: hypothetical protein COA84_14130 [Robiginitomaculum sp.]